MNNITYKTLPNGLTLCHIQKDGYVEKQAMLAFGCGSKDIEFKTDKGIQRVPKGTAHFLEHRLFEKRHKNIFDSFAGLGANANAFTGLDMTAYYFSCIDNFEDCLSLLAEMAVKPYFSQKGVEKEMGIIESEITMYEDDPNWQAYFGMLGGLYGKHPIRFPIAGSKEDINSVTPEHLQLLYDSFYVGQNAVLIAAGDIDRESFFEQAEKELTLKDKPAAQGAQYTDRPIEQASAKKHMSVASPIFSIGFKERDFETEPIIRIIASKLLLDIVAGRSSLLYEKLYTQGLVTQPLTLDYIGGRDFGVSLISGSSSNPEKLLSLLQGETDAFLSYGISEQRLNTAVAAAKGRLLQNMDSLGFCCQFTADNFIKSVKTLDFFNKYDNINVDSLTERLKNHFRGDNLSMCRVLPM